MEPAERPRAVLGWRQKASVGQAEPSAQVTMAGGVRAVS